MKELSELNVIFVEKLLIKHLVVIKLTYIRISKPEVLALVIILNKF